MRRPVLVATMSVLVACAGFACGADAAAATPDELVAAAPQVGTLRVLLSQNGNVRYAPTTQAKVIVTLPKGTEVEILGAAKVEGWYVVRFPRQGRAWVHSKVLQALDGGKRWRVTEDRARARDDSTLRSEIVAELNKGEVLEDKGQLNGDWRAVYLPNAVAYISKTVLDLPANIDVAIKDANKRAEDASRNWDVVEANYANFYAQLQKDPQSAMSLDWAGLATLLDTVIRDHPDADTRVSAQRLKDGIVNVAAHSDALAKAKGITPVKQPIDTGIAALPPTQPTQPGQAAPVAKGPQQPLVDPTLPPILTVPTEQPQPLPTQPAPQPQPTGTVEAPANPGPLTIPTPPAVPRKILAKGFVTQKNFDQVGVTEVLTDSDSNVIAFLKVPVGSDVQLSSYVWRWVGVYGEAQAVDQAKHGLGRDIPLYIVSDLKLDPR